MKSMFNLMIRDSNMHDMHFKMHFKMQFSIPRTQKQGSQAQNAKHVTAQLQGLNLRKIAPEEMLLTKLIEKEPGTAVKSFYAK
jgi:hypothetical protein